MGCSFEFNWKKEKTASTYCRLYDEEKRWVIEIEEEDLQKWNKSEETGEKREMEVVMEIAIVKRNTFKITGQRKRGN